ncbi:MAG: site-specific DNA-methyltransferase [Selenomonadaceae bacterium]|nr:site-specific DNA-methyltransferase [Selenomonadaceae bacterium]
MYNQIYNIDCLEGMKEIPDGAVDFILSDLPFGMVDCDWDKRIPFEPMWEQFKRVTKHNAAIALFANGKFLIELAASNLKMYRYKIVWLKNLATGFLNAKKMPLKAHEDILIFYRKLPTYNPQFTKGKPYTRGGFRQSTCYTDGKRIRQPEVEYPDKRFPYDFLSLRCSNGRACPFNGEHVNQKPVDLLEWLIKTYSNAGELVLDATIGSGSTAVACVNTGRQFIGYETDEHYFEVAQRRIREAQAKKAQELFDSTAVE